MVTAEDARGWTALHYACRTIAQSERSDSAADLSLVKERAEEVRARDKGVGNIDRANDCSTERKAVPLVEHKLWLEGVTCYRTPQSALTTI